MTTGAAPLVFFDASCLIAASGSSTGGSARILGLCSRGIVRGAISQLVVLEAERNITAKLKPPAAERFEQLLTSLPLLIAPLPTQEPQPELVAITGDKDAHVLAAALALNAQYLLTLDKHLIERIKRAEQGVVALTPGDFITTILTTLSDKDAPGG